MIELDFQLTVSSMEPQTRGIQRFSDKSIRMNLLYGELTFIVNAVDLAWKGVVSIIDVARQLYWAVDRLRTQQPEQTVELLDDHSVIRLSLQGSCVALYSEYTRGRTVCELVELRESAYQFGMKALRTCFELFFEAATSREFRDNFPLRLHDP